jgi:hypothetical protein
MIAKRIYNCTRVMATGWSLGRVGILSVQLRPELGGHQLDECAR